MATYSRKGVGEGLEGGEGLESANKESRSVSKSACGGMPCTPGMPPSSS